MEEQLSCVVFLRQTETDANIFLRKLKNTYSLQSYNLYHSYHKIHCKIHFYHYIQYIFIPLPLLQVYNHTAINSTLAFFSNIILSNLYLIELLIMQGEKPYVRVRLLTYISCVLDAKLERQGAQQVSKGELQSLT